MQIDHPFTSARGQRCEFLIDEATACGEVRTVHKTSAVADGRSPRRPIHPRRTEVYQAVTSVPDLDIAVDQEGNLVLHVARAGAHTITNLDTLVAELELARHHAKRFAFHPEFYAAGRAPRPALSVETPRRLLDQMTTIEPRGGVV